MPVASGVPPIGGQWSVRTLLAREQVRFCQVGDKEEKKGKTSFRKGRRAGRKREEEYKDHVYRSVFALFTRLAERHTLGATSCSCRSVIQFRPFRRFKTELPFHVFPPFQSLLTAFSTEADYIRFQENFDDSCGLVCGLNFYSHPVATHRRGVA